MITNTEIKKQLIENMKDCSDFENYVACLGWCDWMQEYVTGEEITESESKNINNFLLECWEDAHK